MHVKCAHSKQHHKHKETECCVRNSLKERRQTSFENTSTEIRKQTQTHFPHTFPTHTTQGLMRKTLGRPAEVTSLLCSIINSVGTCIAYVIIISNNLTPVIASLLFPSFIGDEAFVTSLRVYVVVGVVLLFILPLCCLRKVSQLRFSSFLMLLCTIYLVTVVTLSCLFGAVDYSERPIPGLLEGGRDAMLKAVVPMRWDAGFLQAVPIFVFSFNV